MIVKEELLINKFRWQHATESKLVHKFSVGVVTLAGWYEQSTKSDEN